MGADSLVMGMATGYGVDQLVPFVLSLRQHHAGPARLFVGRDPEVQAFLDQFAISWTEVDPAGSDLHPSILRLEYCRNALDGSLQAWRHVLACDVRDVVFQGDPFADVPDAPLVYFIEATAENPATLSEAHNQHWLKTAFGEAVFERLKDKPILCSGTIMGTHKGMRDYLAVADRMIAEIPATARGAAGLDQAILNRVAYDGLVPGAVFRDNGIIVANLCGMVRETVHWDFAEQKAICRGERPAVLHQYDRHPAVAGIVARRYAKTWQHLRNHAGQDGLGAALAALVAAATQTSWPGLETDSPSVAAAPPAGAEPLILRPAPQAADSLSWGLPDLSIFTLATANYAAWAITLLESARRYEPTAERFLFLLDPLPEGAIDPCLATLVPIESLDFPELDSARFAYSPFEMANAIKPYAFRWLFRARPGRPAIFFDSDICLLAPLDSVRSALEGGAELVLTPHLDSPLADGKRPNDIDVIRSGVNNMGFIAARPAAEAERFMGWWAERLARDCRVALDEGIFVDQSWAMLAQSFVKRTALLRDPGCNVAYWNLPDRPLTASAEGWRAAGRPLAFFHFSGLQVAPPVLSVHQNRLPADGGAAGRLMMAYIARLEANGHAHWSTLPYGYGRYRDGRPIEAGHRLYYQRRLRDGGVQGDPFALPPSFWAEPDPETPQDAPYMLTRQMVALWMSRPDLVRHFPLESPAGRAGLARWAEEWGEGKAGPLIENESRHAADPHLANIALRKEIAALRASTSWRLTAPLRWLVGLSRR